MTQLLPKIRVRTGEGIGNEVWVSFPNLTGAEKTFFDADEAAAQTTISANGTNFGVDQYVVMGVPGTERCEIVKTHAATPSTATTMTTGATAFPHLRGEPIIAIPYNQIELSNSTDGVTYTPLTAVGIRPDALETYIPRAADLSTYYYKFRFKNSTGTTYSDYSDVVLATGPADNSVWSIKNRAIKSLGEKLGGFLTDQFLNDSLNEARRELDQDPRVLRWSFRIVRDYDAGDCIPGRYSISAPTDLRDLNTSKNILALRIGRQQTPLPHQDANRFNENYLNIAHTTLNGAIVTGATSIVLTSSGDFDESGTVYVAAESIAGTLDSAAYTTNTESTATLGTVTGVTDNHATLRDVWQNATFGAPTGYNIANGVIKFDMPFSDTIAGENIRMDYYQALQATNSDSDLLDEPYWDHYVSYLRWKIKYLKSNGKLTAKEDGDYAEWMAGKERVVMQEVSGQDVFLIPSDE